MAKTIFDPAARQQLLARLDRLSATATPRWGKFTAPKMVAHLIDGTRMGLGDYPVKPRRSVMRLPVLRSLIIRVLPWPKGAPTAPELLKRVPETWASDIALIKSLIERAGALGVAGPWSPHPLFGALSGSDWGALLHRHIDHHLSQFGV